MQELLQFYRNIIKLIWSIYIFPKNLVKLNKCFKELNILDCCLQVIPLDDIENDYFNSSYQHFHHENEFILKLLKLYIFHMFSKFYY